MSTFPLPSPPSASSSPDSASAPAGSPGAAPLRIRVVGGHFSGLATAVYLLRVAAEAGLPEPDLKVYEDSDAPIRIFKTERDPPRRFLCESLLEGVFNPGPVLLDLVDHIGRRQSWQRALPESSRRFLLHQGKIVAFPDSPGAWMTGAPWLPLGERLRAASAKLRGGASAKDSKDDTLESLIAQRIGATAGAVLGRALTKSLYLGDDSPGTWKRTLPASAEWLARHEGNIAAALTAAAAPIPRYQEYIGALDGLNLRPVSAVRSPRQLQGLPAELPPAPPAPEAADPEGLFALAAGSLLSFAGGMEELSEGLAAKLGTGRIVCQRRVAHIGRAGAAAPWKLQLATGESEEADIVILAAGSAESGALLAGFDAAAARPLREGFPGVAVAAIGAGYRKDHLSHPLNGLGCIVADSPRGALAALHFSAHAFIGRAPVGHAVVRYVLTGDEAAACDSEEKLLALAESETAGALGIGGKPVWLRTFRLGRALTHFNEEHSRRIAELREAAGRHAGLHFAGEWIWGRTLEQRATGAQALARALLTAPPGKTAKT